ncbi:MAG: hypothetical protein ABJZ55_10400 [Fuerstiella sp.]
MKPLRTLLLLTACIALVGCHCLPCAENHNSRIDHIADHNTNWDGSALSRLDVTRIGKPDGPACFRCQCNTCR